MKNTNRHLRGVPKCRAGCMEVIVGERGEELTGRKYEGPHQRKIHRHRIFPETLNKVCAVF